MPARMAGDAVRDRDMSARGAPFHVPTEAALWAAFCWPVRRGSRGARAVTPRSLTVEP
ncbi:hypothetical protein EMIT0111MI5_130046 [Burkholderia sp. IT-111MI5]